MKAFYVTHGIPEERADFVAGSYENKLTLFLLWYNKSEHTTGVYGKAVGHGR